MPRPTQKTITLTIDGHEVQAAENAMLVDAAKNGDIEIPVFCYEPKLGQPVGACRMCLVEIEGIPKLQTACSTPVKDGMVVNTQNQRVKEAQESVVEFLLVNHPLDCPVCDKGGECPLQDIAFGWGRGRSRFIEAKRHFEKPIELSPTIAIDRERCILCYRCVRFSQEVAEDHQLVLLERGSDSYVSTFDGHPYIAPFSGNITELCPVGALTSQPYRFRARPWDIEGSGTVCTLCPSQCNVELTIRDDKVIRVLARDNQDVDDGWLCDKGRFAYQSVRSNQRITQPLIRDGGTLRPTTWERALSTAAGALKRAGNQAAALAGSSTTNEEGYLLQKLFREGLGSAHLDSRLSGSTLPRQLQTALDQPELQATVADVEFAHTVLLIGAEPLDEMPILDLRIRKGIRRNNVKLAVVSERPSTLAQHASFSANVAPDNEGLWLQVLRSLRDELRSDAWKTWDKERDGSEPDIELAKLLRESGEDVVIVVSEGLFAKRYGAEIAATLREIAAELKLDQLTGAGLLVIPSGANGRGLREVGVLPDAAPGYQPSPLAGKNSQEIATGLCNSELTTIYLDNIDPLRDLKNAPLWDEALTHATSTIVRSSFLSETLKRHATVVFPAEAYAEQEGTVTHPDGRLQRLRTAIGRPNDTYAGWQILTFLAKEIGFELPYLTCSAVSKELFEAVPFYRELTLETIGGRGIRWQEREQANLFPTVAAIEANSQAITVDPATQITPEQGQLRLATFRSLWSSPEVEHAPALAYLRSKQRVEISPEDAKELGIAHGDRVEVAAGDRKIEATAALREAVSNGVIFMHEGIAQQNANLFGEHQFVTVAKAQPTIDVKMVTP